MRNYLFYLLISVSCCVASPSAKNIEPAAFGLKMGEKKGDLQALIKREISPFVFELKTVPKPHNSFEGYIVVIGNNSGVCRIKAVGKTIENDAFGTGLNGAFKKISDQLDLKYGDSFLSVDSLHDGSIWKGNSYWMKSLAEKERSLFSFWRATESESIDFIGLEAKGLTSNSGYLVLEYDLKNFDDCKEEIDRTEADAL